ncbi:MAG TPA: hypothetical protein VGC87_09475 [Pyrinomonadaceae bacterium]|jgi:hypothetical protein
MGIPADQLQKLLEALQFGNTYPGFAPVSASEQGGPSAAAPSALQQRVVSALQGVLGRTFKEGDYRSFRVALEASFEIKEVGGRQTYEWKPRAYPLTGGSDLGGGVTGAQYSLVSLANVLYEQTTDLIENLSSLTPDVDEEQLEASRAVFRSTWSEFITELGREGGPRVPKADSHADSIYATGTTTVGSDLRFVVTGHLVRFGRLLGMIPPPEVGLPTHMANDLSVADQRTTLDQQGNTVGTGRYDVARFNVLTTDEEENLTNFIALTDIYLTVSQSWRSYRDTFLQATVERDLGTGLLSLERLFAVLEESVSEVYVSMDSVNVDQAERLVIHIDPADQSSITVEDLLSWVTTFASTEGPLLVRDGGKWGVQAIKPTASKLRELAEGLITRLDGGVPPAQTTLTTPGGRGRTGGGSANLVAGSQGGATTTADGFPPAFRHARVLNPMREMLSYLRAIEDTANSIV